MATTQWIGASLSNMVAGPVVVGAGYSAAFLALAGAALAAFRAFLAGMPETREFGGTSAVNEAATTDAQAREL